MTYKYKNRKLEQAMMECALSIQELSRSTQMTRFTIRRMLDNRPVRRCSIRKVCGVLQRTPINVGLAPMPSVDLTEVV